MNKKHLISKYTFSFSLLSFFVFIIFFISCARMGQPDGGWYDEQPPRMVSSSPVNGATNINTSKIIINFDEYIRLDNPATKVIISPPQIEPADIKVQGRRIVIDLKDTLQENTTYTIDFADAITDNTEGNAMENFTFSFSTGSEIDTMQVSGCVVEAHNMEPVKDILVGLYPVEKDYFTTQPMRRIARTDGSGHFVIKGIAPGSYRIYALADADGNFYFSQKGEKVAFLDNVIVPSSKPDIRQDTIWRDSLHISGIIQTGYTHFLPDDIILRAFSEKPTERYLMRSDRRDADRLTFVFSTGHDEIPKLQPLNFNVDENSFLTETSTEKDTVVFWLRDTTLLSQDTLQLVATYLANDSLGNLSITSDTLDFISRIPYAKRLRDYNRRQEQWHKQQEKAKKQERKIEYIMPEDTYILKYNLPNEVSPNSLIGISFPTPADLIDTTLVSISLLTDTVWTNVPITILNIDNEKVSNNVNIKQETMSERRSLFIDSDWIIDGTYRLEVDSAAFIDIYGRPSLEFKKKFHVRKKEDFVTLQVNIQGTLADSSLVIELLNTTEKVIARQHIDKGKVVFDYILPDTYYLRAFIDSNNNGKHDSGVFDEKIQPEMVFYNPHPIEVREKWDMKENWNPLSIPPSRQKPNQITRQQSNERRVILNKNQERARKLGKTYPPTTR